MLDQARPCQRARFGSNKEREKRLKIAHEYILSMKIYWVKSPNKERKIVRFLSLYPSYFRHLQATWLTNGELHWTYTELITFDSIGVHILTHNQLRLQETSPSTYPLTKCPFDVTSRSMSLCFSIGHAAFVEPISVHSMGINGISKVAEDKFYGRHCSLGYYPTTFSPNICKDHHAPVRQGRSIMEMARRHMSTEGDWI